jgi:hypothetical protein
VRPLDRHRDDGGPGWRRGRVAVVCVRNPPDAVAGGVGPAVVRTQVVTALVRYREVQHRILAGETVTEDDLVGGVGDGHHALEDLRGAPVRAADDRSAYDDADVLVLPPDLPGGGRRPGRRRGRPGRGARDRAHGRRGALPRHRPTRAGARVVGRTNPRPTVRG